MQSEEFELVTEVDRYESGAVMADEPEAIMYLDAATEVGDGRRPQLFEMALVESLLPTDGRHGELAVTLVARREPAGVERRIGAAESSVEVRGDYHGTDRTPFVVLREVGSEDYDRRVGTLAPERVAEGHDGGAGTALPEQRVTDRLSGLIDLSRPPTRPTDEPHSSLYLTVEFEVSTGAPAT